MKNKQCVFLTPPQIAKRLGITGDKVLAWINTRSLRAMNLSNGNTRPRWKIHPDDLQVFLDSKSNQNEGNQ